MADKLFKDYFSELTEESAVGVSSKLLTQDAAGNVKKIDVNKFTATGGYDGTTQDLKDEVDSINFDGVKVYETLAQAQAVTPTPADYTGFSVDPETDPENAGQYYYLASEPNGTKFYRAYLEVNTTSTKELVSKNIFNKNDVLENTRLNNLTGIPFTGSGWKCILNIPITQSGKGVYVQGRGILSNLFPFDSDGNLLDSVYGNSDYNAGAPNAFYALPENTASISLDIEHSSETIDLDLVQIAYELEPSSVVPFEEKEVLTSLNNKETNTTKLQTSVSIGKNLFNPLSYLLGTSMTNVAYPSGGDILVKDTDSACTRLIPCEPLTDYYVSGRLSNIKGFGFYDVNGDILPPVQGSTYWGGVANGVYTSPVDAVAMRFQVAFSGSGDPSIVQLEKGNVETSFEPYTETEKIDSINGISLGNESEDIVTTEFYTGQAVLKESDLITIVSDYSSTHKSVIKFKRHLVNNLMLISDAYLILSSGSIKASDFTASSSVVLIDANSTDVISPYKLNDGFDTNASPFISGNHAAAGTPTATLLDYKVLADGIELTDGVVTQCSEVNILTKSEVYSFSGQALPTPAEDVVFDEYHTYTISGNTIAVNVGLDIKQSIEFITLYSIQGTPFLSDIDNIYVNSSNEPLIEPYVDNVQKSFGPPATYPDIERATFTSDTHNHCVSHWIDKTVGLAVSPQTDAYNSAFFVSSGSGKVYFNLINLDRGLGINYVAGDFIEYRGGFNLFENKANQSDEIVGVRKERGSDLIVFDIATDSSTVRESLLPINSYCDRSVDELSKSSTVTSVSNYIDSRGVLKVSSNGNAAAKYLIK